MPRPKRSGFPLPPVRVVALVSRDLAARVKVGQNFKNVKRLNILFDAEDKPTWEARRKAARLAREEAKARLRYDFYLKRQPMEEFRAIQKSTIVRVHSNVARGLPVNISFPEQVCRPLSSLSGYCNSAVRATLVRLVRARHLESWCDLRRKKSSKGTLEQ
jgi:hypothetical protein